MERNHVHYPRVVRRSIKVHTSSSEAMLVKIGSGSVLNLNPF